MGRIEKTVFISYRRTNMPWALAIYQNLTAHGYDVFFDYESIPSGDFAQVIFQNIRARAHFLVILTPSAMERCVNPDDWLRREIETAIDERRNIVPVFLEGFDFGSPSISKYLTGKMEMLKKYNGQNVPAGFFDEAMQRVRNNFLNVPLDAVLHPVSTMVRNEVIKQQVAVSQTTQVEEKELTAQEWFETAYKHGENKNFDEAIRCYTQAISLKPDYADAYNNRGVACYGKGNLDGAIKDWTEAIRLKPDHALAYTGRGVARRAKGDLDGAIKDHTEAIRIKPDYATAYDNRGAARQEKGDLDGAIKDHTETIRIKPDYASAYYNRGNALDNKGDLDGAIKDYTEAIRIKPDYANAYYNRALVWDKKDDYYSAIVDFQKYIDLGNTDSYPLKRIQELKKRIK